MTTAEGDQAEGHQAAGAVDRAAGLASFRRYTWWTLPGTVAIILVVVMVEWLLDPAVPAALRVTGATALAVTVTASVVLLSRRVALAPATDAAKAVEASGPGRTVQAAGPGRTVGWLVTGAVGALGLGVTMLVAKEYGLWAVGPSILTAIAAAYLPARRRRMLLIVAVVVATLPGALVDLLTGGGDQLLFAVAFPPGLVVFTAWVTLGPLWAWDITGQLEQARRLAAELAVKDERLRFAADLHDIQGHHLQVIALKSELAARLVEVDPARATAQIAEVRQLAAAALTETRALVQGYRRTSLAEEIANATRVLAAADIDATTHFDPSGGDPSESCRHLLGLVMREATTNVLRHSHAGHAEVHYRVDDGRAYLRISNDGSAGRPGQPAGSGLVTLARRLLAVGGDLTWRRDGERFLVAANLPLAAPKESG